MALYSNDGDEILSDINALVGEYFAVEREKQNDQINNGACCSRNCHLKKGPGPFYLENGESCPFCDDENKIPVVINNNLTNEVKKIPMNLMRDEAGIMSSRFADMFRNSERDDNAIRKIYTNYVYKDGSNCSLDTMIKSQPKAEQLNLSAMRTATAATCIDDDFLTTLNLLHNNIDPSIMDYYVQQKTQTPASSDMNEILDAAALEKSRSVGKMVRAIVEDYRLKLEMEDKKEEEEAKKSDSDAAIREAMNICRQKDPFLREIHLAIFGGAYMNLPKEGSKEYYKMAEDYALFHVTPPSTSDSNTSKNYYSPSKNLSSTMCNMPSKTNAETKTDPKKSLFEDSAIISEEIKFSPIQQQQQQQNQSQSQQQQAHQQSIGSSYPSFDASTFFHPGASVQGNYLNANTACSNNLNPYQMPGSFLAYNSLNQKAKPRTNTKLAQPAQMPLFLTPHQYLMQASQSPAFPSANYPQTLMQPQPNFPNLQAPGPLYNTSFKETHINTAIIQQQQFQQYNVLSSAGAGNYEMFIYEQMLHQTQKIKTVIARNRLEKRTQMEMAKNASKVTTAVNSSPTVNSNASTLNGRTADGRLMVFSQITSNADAASTLGSGLKGANETSVTSTADSVDDVEVNKFDVNADQISEGSLEV